MSNSNLLNEYNEYLKIKSKLKNLEPFQDFKNEVDLFISDKLKDVENNPENIKYNKKVYSFFERRILIEEYSFLKSEWIAFNNIESNKCDYSKSFITTFMEHLDHKLGSEELLMQELQQSAFRTHANQIAQSLVSRIFDLSKSDEQLYQSIKALSELTPNKLSQPKKRIAKKNK